MQFDCVVYRAGEVLVRGEMVMWPFREGALSQNNCSTPPECTSVCKELRFLKAEVNVLHGRIKLLESALMKQEKVLRDDWK